MGLGSLVLRHGSFGLGPVSWVLCSGFLFMSPGSCVLRPVFWVLVLEYCVFGPGSCVPGLGICAICNVQTSVAYCYIFCLAWS